MSISSLRGENDYFLILGDNPEIITKKYVSLVGMPIMPTLKMLGNYYRFEEPSNQIVYFQLEDKYTYDSSRSILISYFCNNFHQIHIFHWLVVDYSFYLNLS